MSSSVISLGILFLVTVLLDTVYGAKHVIWDGALENAWTIDYFSGSGEAPEGTHLIVCDTPGKTGSHQSIYFQVIQWGGLTIRHDYTSIDISQYSYLNYMFYWTDTVSQYEMQTQIKQDTEVWSGIISLTNFTRGQWNTISLPLSSFNMTASSVNQIQIQKSDAIPCDAWVNWVYFTDGTDTLDPCASSKNGATPLTHLNVFAYVLVAICSLLVLQM